LAARAAHMVYRHHHSQPSRAFAVSDEPERVRLLWFCFDTCFLYVEPGLISLRWKTLLLSPHQRSHADRTLQLFGGPVAVAKGLAVFRRGSPMAPPVSHVRDRFGRPFARIFNGSGAEPARCAKTFPGQVYACPPARPPTAGTSAADPSLFPRRSPHRLHTHLPSTIARRCLCPGAVRRCARSPRAALPMMQPS